MITNANCGTFLDDDDVDGSSHQHREENAITKTQKRRSSQDSQRGGVFGCPSDPVSTTVIVSDLNCRKSFEIGQVVKLCGEVVAYAYPHWVMSPRLFP